MRRSLFILGPLAMCLALVAALGQPDKPGPTTASAKPRKPTTAVPLSGCVTHECHVAVKGFAVVHGPVNVNACDVCHELTDAAEHKYRLRRERTQTCTFCHRVETPGETAGLIHKPLLQGDCLPCHHPHGGSDRNFLRGGSMSQLCNSCHKDLVGGRRYAHGPAAAGACGVCHEAHRAQFPKLLVAQGSDLCLNCHTQMRSQLRQVKFVHKALDKDCTQCHDAHASNYAMQVRLAPAEMCTANCHEKVRADALAAQRKHSVVVKDQACLHCHVSHGGDLTKLMKSEPVRICMTCHDKKIDVPARQPILALPDMADPKLVKHGPVRDGNCAGCHNAHGGPLALLLSRAYPSTFYEGFDAAKYDLCFSCHDSQLATAKETLAVTGLRNGPQNLHYLHVNKPRQGRSCRACHSTHASCNPLHVRQSVPYGGWQMPINFTRSRTGGTCASGCHEVLSYDRVNPVPPRPKAPLVPATAPASQPAQPATGKE